MHRKSVLEVLDTGEFLLFLTPPHIEAVLMVKCGPYRIHNSI